MTRSETVLKWQSKQRAKGICIKCSNPLLLGNKNFCEQHAAYASKRGRDRYRIAKGIPLDAPNHPDAITTYKRALLSDLESAFRRVIAPRIQTPAKPVRDAAFASILEGIAADIRRELVERESASSSSQPSTLNPQPHP